MKKFGFLAGVILLGLPSCAQTETTTDTMADDSVKVNETMDTATFGGGCFWCVETIFQQLQGVQKVESGYSGGTVKNPSYKEVCTGNTGHAEVVNIYFDPSKISYGELLGVFFAVHDPTTLNRQGGDVGTQYRSSVFYHSDEQKAIAEDVIRQLSVSGEFADPIVTTLERFDVFYKAEDYHQDYFNINPDQPYCNAVIRPKVEKFRKKYASKLKESVANNH
jgi:peptide-methionine (S)-S-oxide reductase